MNWLNIRVSVIRTPEYLGSEPVARATWVNVLCFCAELENGGRIVGAKAWKDRQWQQACGVTLGEVNASSPLLFWEGDDLVVWNYPVEKEAEVKVRRDAGRSGGVRSGEARREAQLQPTNEAKVERKEKENEKGKEVGRVKAPPADDEEWLSELQQKPAYQALNVQVEYSKMVEWCRINRKLATRPRFVNWLNRCERPMLATNAPPRFTNGRHNINHPDHNPC